MKHYADININKSGGSALTELVNKYKIEAVYDENGDLIDMSVAKQIAKMSDEEFVKKFSSRWPELKEASNAVSYTETLTLDPSARIITYNDLSKVRSGYEESIIEKQIDALNVDERYKFTLRDRMFGVDDADEKIKQDAIDWYRGMNQDERKEFNNTMRNIRKTASEANDKVLGMDDGSFAAMLGYDAINAEGHGESNSYTVILNRTKVIFKKGS
jgi:hypothetical protein